MSEVPGGGERGRARRSGAGQERSGAARGRSGPLGAGRAPHGPARPGSAGGGTTKAAAAPPGLRCLPPAGPPPGLHRPGALPVPGPGVRGCRVRGQPPPRAVPAPPLLRGRPATFSPCSAPCGRGRSGGSPGGPRGASSPPAARPEQRSAALPAPRAGLLLSVLKSSFGAAPRIWGAFLAAMPSPVPAPKPRTWLVRTPRGLPRVWGLCRERLAGTLKCGRGI